MTIFWSPDGHLNISADASDLPESVSDGNSRSGAMARCKNLRLDEPGKAKTRDGSAKLNTTAIANAIWWIEVQAGTRYTFAGQNIYEDETSIASGLTSAQWAAIKYNAFNDTKQNVFALNGTDRKRIESGTVYEWGIAAPTGRPTLTIGQGTGLTGKYNAKYSYVRKVSGVTVAESNLSPAARLHIELTDQSLAVGVDAPSDSQVTHIRLYRTLNGGVQYYRDQDIPVDTYTHGISQTWEDTDNYISGDAFKFTITDTTHTTENTYTWEELFRTSDEDDATGPNIPWYLNADGTYNEEAIAYLRESVGTGDVVLVKGSRSLQMDQIVAALSEVVDT